MAKKAIFILSIFVFLIALASISFAYEQTFVVYDSQDMEARYNQYFYNSDQTSYVNAIKNTDYAKGYREGYNDASAKFYGKIENTTFNDPAYASDTQFRYTKEVKDPMKGASYSQPKLLTRTYVQHTYASSNVKYYPGKIIRTYSYSNQLTRSKYLNQ